MHVIGACTCLLAFAFGVIGFVKKNGKNICSAVLYVIGGLTVSMSALQFVSVVDDEMQPRMKPNAAGEPSTFSYSYGLPFTVSALSFIPVQLCVYLQTHIFFIRYPSPDDKTKAIPGLRNLRNVYISNLSLKILNFHRNVPDPIDSWNETSEVES